MPRRGGQKTPIILFLVVEDLGEKNAFDKEKKTMDEKLQRLSFVEMFSPSGPLELLNYLNQN